MADANSVIDAILAATQDSHVRQAMALGADLESSLNPGDVGDQGTSFGPFQIHLPAHPGVTKEQAEDPTFATKFMLPAYTTAAQAQGNLWNSNPELAAERTAFAAERPKVDYIQSDGQKTVDQKWRDSQVLLGLGDMNQTANAAGQAVMDTSNPISALLGPITDIGGALVKIGKLVDIITTFITTKLFLPQTWARVLAFGAGVTLILVGLFLFFSKPGTAANLAGDIPKVVPV